MTFWQGVAVGVAGTCATGLAFAAFLRWLFSGARA